MYDEGPEVTHFRGELNYGLPDMWLCWRMGFRYNSYYTRELPARKRPKSSDAKTCFINMIFDTL